MKGPSGRRIPPTTATTRMSIAEEIPIVPGAICFDLLNGGSTLREWVDDAAASAADLDALATQDEAGWRAERESVLLY